jgi:hypothetical protein
MSARPAALMTDGKYWQSRLPSRRKLPKRKRANNFGIEHPIIQGIQRITIPPGISRRLLIRAHPAASGVIFSGR